jgi:Prokaryotic membrane lipoprotein lipid attachment site.
MKKPLIVLTVTLMLAGCSTLKTDQAIPLLQAETAKMLGLGSSDEITVSNVNGAQPDALGGQKTLLSRHDRKRAYFRLFIDDDAGNFRICTDAERANLYTSCHT